MVMLQRPVLPHIMRIVVVIVLLAASFEAKPTSKSASTCGYDSCKLTTDDHLNVHIVPHSHDDVGWLKTVDQYYYGSKTYVQKAGVQYIIDSVVRALAENEERRFIQVETAFFYKWWIKQTDAKKELVRKLVNNGQLEFTGGAWSMNDEAAAHYHSIVDQFTFGLTFLNDTFGECGRPKIGWQIDPFGHSKEMATIYAQLGYDGLFFSRLDWRDKGRRMITKTPEMIWQGSHSLGNASNMFTSVLYNHYSAPPGYCFDIICQDDPIIDDPFSPDYNYESKVVSFANFLKGQAANYPTNNIIITMGDDFNYQDATYYFTNLDKLVKGFEKWPQKYLNKTLNVFYSTPSCYVKAVNEEATRKKQAFPVKTDDFFPYASDYHAYWSGYFTSRPTSKHYERQANNFLQVHKQLACQNATTKSTTFKLQDAVGIMQHHDAITGTEKQHVADDYARILDDSMTDSEFYVNDLISKLLAKEGHSDFDLKLTNCLLANISVCPYSIGEDFVVAIYNPLSRPVDYYAKLPVNNLDYKILGPKGENVTYQISAAIDSFDLGPFYHAKYDLFFLANKIPPLGVHIYRISAVHYKERYKYTLKKDESDGRFKLGDDLQGLSLDEDTGLLDSVVSNGTTIKIKQQLMYYIGARGDNMVFENRASGAYIFRPSPNFTEALPMATKVNISVYRGVLFDEVHQQFNDWAKQIIRYYKATGNIEFDWLIGPIPINDGDSKEIISRFVTPVDSADEFYTDSNGKEMIKRIRNYRQTYNYTNEEPVAGNYYPVTSKISVKDDKYEISVLNDRAQGGTSLKSGEMELMMHRRLLNDDAFGVGEALNEYEHGRGLMARGSHYLVVQGKEFHNVVDEKRLRQERVLSPWLLISNATANSVTHLSDNINLEFSGLKKSLPDNVQLLTLEPHRQLQNLLILRLEHIYEVGEHDTLSKEVKVDLNDLFTKFTITSLRETTLGADRWLDEDDSFDWILGGSLESVDYYSEFDLGKKATVLPKNVQKEDHLLITMKPMEIRTFIVRVVHED